MHKTRQQVIEAYITADTAEDFLLGEFTDFFGEAMDPADAVRAGEDAMLRAREGADALLQNTVYHKDVASVTVIIADPRTGEKNGTVFSRVPSPEALLLLCGNNAGVDQEVILAWTYNDGRQMTTSATWPFGVDAAVGLTTVPDPDEYVDDEDDDGGPGPRIIVAKLPELTPLHKAITCGALAAIAFAIVRRARH